MRPPCPPMLLASLSCYARSCLWAKLHHQMLSERVGAAFAGAHRCGPGSLVHRGGCQPARTHGIVRLATDLVILRSLGHCTARARRVDAGCDCGPVWGRYLAGSARGAATSTGGPFGAPKNSPCRSPRSSPKTTRASATKGGCLLGHSSIPRPQPPTVDPLGNSIANGASAPPSVPPPGCRAERGPLDAAT